ncbi:LuxR C-terminal-related transcriptional regulator [Lentzea sp. NPDC042327]|uniref:ATP-binding protein n=1 Tax=Lentzea sp. NPDC042327 TaxID=3154801 RepID=UPI0033E62292
MTVRDDLLDRPTAFIGRHAELAEARALLGRSRLVTLVGTGGVGKTRIAVETARAVRDDTAFRHGVWLVPLGELDDPALLARTVAAGLRVVDNGRDAGPCRLVEALYDKHLMLVLDGCDHLLDAVRDLVHHLLRHCEGLTVLVTSRAPLNLYGECVLLVPPLSADDALALFRDRVAVAEAGLPEALDGTPLAVELAATRPGEPVRAPVLEWVARGCSDEERELWAALSVFPADFDLAAATALCGREISLSALVDRVLVTVSANPVAERTRYRLQDTVARFGTGLLTDPDAVRRRHVRHYSAVAEEAARSWFSPDDSRWVARLREEWPNLRTAIGYALRSPGLAPTGATMLIDLGRTRFPVLAGVLGQFQDLLAIAREAVGPPLRTSLAAHQALLALTQGDLAAAGPLLSELRGQPPDAESDVDLMWVEATQLFLVAGSADCVPVYERLAELSRERSAPGDTYVIELFLATASCLLLDAEAADKATTALAAKSTGVAWSTAWALWHRGLYELLHGDPALAHPHAAEALRIQLTLGDTHGPAHSLWLLACTCAELGAHDRATRLLGALRSQERTTRISFAGLTPFRVLLERADRTVRRALGDDHPVIATLGADLRPDQAMELALEPVPDSERRPPRPTLPGGLTRQEFTIAGLVADGFSAKQIGARLFISPRTADRHVVNIRTKLGLPSRVALAAWHRSVTGDDPDRRW